MYPKSYISDLLIPTLWFVSFILLIKVVNIDLLLADYFYFLQNHNWAMRDAWLTQTVIHEGGRKLVAFIASSLFLLIISSIFITSLEPYRKGLLYILSTAVVSGLLINYLKFLTHVNCPWDLIRYGGSQSYSNSFIFQFGSNGNCFPAGHASAGYAWFGLYFFARTYCKKWRNLALYFPLTLGLVFGISQQIRGAHFLSHDLWTIWICWMIAATFSRVMPEGDTAPLQNQYFRFPRNT